MKDSSSVPDNLMIDATTGELSVLVGATTASLQFSIVVETRRPAKASIHRLSVDGFSVDLVCGSQSYAITPIEPQT